jgi:hypothetical protein
MTFICYTGHVFTHGNLSKVQHITFSYEDEWNFSHIPQDFFVKSAIYIRDIPLHISVKKLIDHENLVRWWNANPIYTVEFYLKYKNSDKELCYTSDHHPWLLHNYSVIDKAKKYKHCFEAPDEFRRYGQKLWDDINRPLSHSPPIDEKKESLDRIMELVEANSKNAKGLTDLLRKYIEE